MPKIISYSLWGNKAIYVINAIKNADIAMELFPDWECRYYISPNVKPTIIEELQKRKNTKLIFQQEDESWNGMFWRFYAAADVPTRSDAMISRDADSLLNKRDKACVDRWLESDKDFHIVRDNCAHCTKIMGGIWGVRNGLLSNIKQLIDDYSKKKTENRKNIDQEFLAEIVYPRVISRAMVMDPYGFKRDTNTQIPIPRVGPFLPSEKKQGQDWPDLSDPWRTININGLMYCGHCHRVHDNDYIGKFAYDFSEEDKIKYPFEGTE
jgi:hypothetical protein